MTSFIKKHFKKTLSLLLLTFIILFLFRLVYDYKTIADDTFTNMHMTINDLQSEEDLFENRKNYASKKYLQNGRVPIDMDQKYEKIADIRSNTSKFERAEFKIRTQIKHHDGLIQFENKSGNKGYRTLNLIIGIPPQHFDSIYTSLITVGKIQSKQITKTDKTNEYKELNAKKASLEKIRASLIDLKAKGGRIDEYMQLENRILEIEQQLQALGVSLGNFDDENEFCTVKVLLTEKKDVKISVAKRIKEALEWTIETYLMLMLALCLMSVFGYLLLLIIEKIKTNISLK